MSALFPLGPLLPAIVAGVCAGLAYRLGLRRGREHERALWLRAVDEQAAVFVKASVRRFFDKLPKETRQ